MKNSKTVRNNIYIHDIILKGGFKIIRQYIFVAPKGKSIFISNISK